MDFSIINSDLAEQAGQIFSDEYQRRRASEDTLNSDLGAPGIKNADYLSGQMVEWANVGGSVVAHQDGVVRGYLVGRFIEWFHASKALYIPEWGSAADTDNTHRLIGQMYAWLTRSGQLDGSSVHTVTVFSSDHSAISAWSSLGFGAHLMNATRTTRLGETKNGRSARAAGHADLHRLSILHQQLRVHLSQPPVHLPPDASEFDRGRLPGPGSYTSVAEADGQVVGFMSCRFGAQEAMCLHNDSVPHINGAFLEPKHRGGTVATALLDDVLAWARRNSADRVTTDFETANVEGAGFWLGSGFAPVLTGLVRRIPG